MAKLIAYNTRVKKMNESIEGAKQAAEVVSTGWYHWLPFAALATKGVAPANRPMATRLIEQTLVALIAGGSGTYVTLHVNQARQEEQIKAISAIQAIQIKSLQDQVRDSEIRLTAQIVELRQRGVK